MASYIEEVLMIAVIEVIERLRELPPDQFMFELKGKQQQVRTVGNICDCPITALARYKTGRRYSTKTELTEAIAVVGFDTMSSDPCSLICAADNCRKKNHHDPSLRPLLLQTLREAGLLKESA